MSEFFFFWFIQTELKTWSIKIHSSYMKNTQQHYKYSIWQFEYEIWKLIVSHSLYLHITYTHNCL